MGKISFGAIIPAAGLSSRMEGFKPLAAIAGQTLIERVVNLFQWAGVDEVLVVAGHRSDEIIAALEAAPCRVVVNPDYREEMLTSIKAGARALSGRCGAFFVLPVDIPLVRSLTIRRLMDQFADHAASVTHPVFQARRGHPPLLDVSLIDELLAWQGEGGQGCKNSVFTTTRSERSTLVSQVLSA